MHPSRARCGRKLARFARRRPHFRSASSFRRAVLFHKSIWAPPFRGRDTAAHRLCRRCSHVPSRRLPKAYQRRARAIAIDTNTTMISTSTSAAKSALAFKNRSGNSQIWAPNRNAIANPAPNGNLAFVAAIRASVRVFFITRISLGNQAYV